jgi:signal transduction histidine kinase/putative methionine-R-sulfoxide reductase with GAF domain
MKADRTGVNAGEDIEMRGSTGESAVERLRRIDRALFVNRKCKEVLRWTPLSTTEADLLREVCRIIVERGGYRMSWIGILEHDPDKTIRPIAYAGYEEGYLTINKFSWADNPYGRGPSGIVARNGKPYIAHDIQAEPGFLPWRKEAKARGYASVVTIPMTVRDVTLGVLNIYSGDPDDFDEREVELIAELGRDLAFGIVSRRTQLERDRAQSDLERSMRALDEERRRLRAVLESLPVGVFIADAKGKIVDFNAQVEMIWGGKPPGAETPRDYEVYKGWWAETGKRLKPEDWALFRAVSRGETSIGEIIDIQRFNGAGGTILNSSAPILDQNGNIIGAVVVIQDITRIRELERELKEARDRLELYVDLMAHDINNLNMVGIGYLEMGLKELNETGGIRDKILVEKPLEALQNSSELIEKVRMLQKAQSGQLSVGPVDLCEILSRTVNRYSDNPEREINIDLMPGKECTVEANGLVEEVFNNLVGNAVKHSDPEKPLDITVSVGTELYEGRYVQVSVEDTGPGIPGELKPRLFTRFKRGTTKAHGKGLGLYLVKTLVEGFRGKVWAEDRVPGDPAKGARFVVLLPAARRYS